MFELGQSDKSYPENKCSHKNRPQNYLAIDPKLRRTRISSPVTKNSYLNYAQKVVKFHCVFGL